MTPSPSLAERPVLLEIDDLQTSYGSSQVLFGVGLRIGAGDVATLLGHRQVRAAAGHAGRPPHHRAARPGGLAGRFPRAGGRPRPLAKVHGRRRTLGLAVERVGNSLLTLAMHCRAGEEERMRSRQVLVATDLKTHKARVLPDDVREALDKLPT